MMPIDDVDRQIEEARKRLAALDRKLASSILRTATGYATACARRLALMAEASPIL
jgi:hypothetical protein